MDVMGLDFSVSSLIAGFIFGVIGFWLFKQGKKNVNNPVVVIGMLLMIFPIFVSGAWANWGIGSGLCGLAYYFWNY